MLSISAISKAEKNKLSTDSAFLILLEIRLQNTVYICYNNEDVVWKGQLYQAFPFQIGETSEESDGSDPNVSLKVSNVAQGLQWYVEDSGGGVGTQVILRVVNSLNMNGDADLEEYYTVLSCKVDQQWVEFTLGTDYSARSRRPLDRYMKNNCRFAYKGVLCGYAGAIATCKHTLADCRLHGNSVRFGGYPGIDQKGVYATK
jgi:lambda family phage minor tail protein L